MEKEGNPAQWLLGASAAVAAGGMTGTKLIPMAYQARGYFALGGEWMAVLAVSSAAYLALRLWIQGGRGG